MNAFYCNHFISYNYYISYMLFVGLAKSWFQDLMGAYVSSFCFDQSLPMLFSKCPFVYDHEGCCVCLLCVPVKDVCLPWMFIKLCPVHCLILFLEPIYASMHVYMWHMPISVHFIILDPICIHMSGLTHCLALFQSLCASMGYLAHWLAYFQFPCAYMN